MNKCLFSVRVFFFFREGQCQSIPWAMELWLCWSPETVGVDQMAKLVAGGEVETAFHRNIHREGAEGKQQIRVNDSYIYIYIYIYIILCIYTYWIEMLKSCFFCAWEKTITKHQHVFFFVLKIFHEYVDCPWTKKWSQAVFLGSWTFNYWLWSLLARQTPSLGGAQKSDERRKLPRKLQERHGSKACTKQTRRISRHPFPSFDSTFFEKHLPS